MRDKVPVIVAGLQVFTSLNMTGKRTRWGNIKSDWGDASAQKGHLEKGKEYNSFFLKKG